MAKIHTNISHFFSSSNEQRKYNKKVFFCLSYNPTPFWSPPLLLIRRTPQHHTIWASFLGRSYTRNDDAIIFSTQHIQCICFYMIFHSLLAFITRNWLITRLQYSHWIIHLRNWLITRPHPSKIHSIIMSTHSVFIWPWN